ncbi:MAG: ABC transporter permease [Christensenella sp.]|uniref:ABC transporter permease n=1 Tax=Christensenella sp. TaxID=1935934 RepID=UPI002B1F07BF|nr:ABC transporter permease [Christensenella sp.]MEA5002712.1 ABC transporter permease [Christensenella sp.]
MENNVKPMNPLKALRRNHTSEFGVGIALICLFVAFSIMSPVFLSSRNLINILYQISALGIVAVGQTMIIITGGIDLSVGSVFELAGWSMCYTILNVGLLEGILVGIGVALVCGIINGVLIAHVKLEPFIVTLGTMSIFHGLAYIISDAKPVSNLPKIMEQIDEFTLAGIPSYVLILIVVFVLGFLFLRFTKPGRMIYAIGSNETAAEYTGVRVGMFKMIPYVISAVCALVAAFVQSSHLMAIDPDAGSNLNLDSVAAVVIGGTALTGGRGTLIGTLIGILLMGILRNGLNLMGVSSYWQGVAVGAILIFAVAVERVMRSKRTA